MLGGVTGIMKTGGLVTRVAYSRLVPIFVPPIRWSRNEIMMGGTKWQLAIGLAVQETTHMARETVSWQVPAPAWRDP